MTKKVIALLLLLSAPLYAAETAKPAAPAKAAAAKKTTKTPAKKTTKSKKPVAKKPTPAPAPEPAASPDERAAISACESAVREALKTPPDAVFPADEVKALRENDKRYRVTGAVDAKASSGVLYRKRYSCQAVSDGAGWKAQ